MSPLGSRTLSSPDLSPRALSQHRAFPSLEYRTPPVSEPRSSPADPISALRRTSNASFFMPPGQDESPVPVPVPLRVNSGLESIWKSSGGVSSAWSPATVFEGDSFDFASPGTDSRRYSGYDLTPASTYSLNQTVLALTDAIRLLTTRVATLEHSHRLQDDELTRLRHAVPRPSTPASSTKLQALAAPYLYTPPASTPTGSPSAAFAFPRAPGPPPSVLPQTPPPARRASWTNQYAIGTAPMHDLGRAPSLPSLPEVLVPDSNLQSPAQSPVQSAVQTHGRRRSRANSEIQQAARMRGISFSSIAPVIAQAKWMQGHQVTNINGDQHNFRTLLDQDVDVDPEVFIRRIHETNDQQCSLYLQQRLKADDPQLREKICRAVSDTVVELALNKFGNFLVSRCLEYGGRPVLDDYAAKFQGHILRLAMDQYGCHPLQKLQECGDQGTKDMIIEELIGFVETLTTKSAGHVWSKLLASPNPPTFYRRLSETGAGHWTAIARDETGSLIVQSVLENWAEADRSAIGVECGNNLAGLATSQWGSFVVLHLVEHRAEHFRAKILDDSVRLSTDHFGAKSVEKAFRRERHLDPAAVSLYLSNITSENSGRRPICVDIALHATGAQLLSLFFHVPYVAKKDRDPLARALWKHAAVLDQNQFGQRVLGLAERPLSA